jgi:hypothetical protein
MSYRKPAPAEKKHRMRNPTRRLELALMRLDHRYCVRMLIYFAAAFCTISGVLIGFIVMLIIGLIN